MVMFDTDICIYLLNQKPGHECILKRLDGRELCVESHLRELIEQGFEVAVVKDATAAPRHPELGDGYQAAVINFGFLANAVLTTDDAVSAMK